MPFGQLTDSLVPLGLHTEIETIFSVGGDAAADCAKVAGPHRTRPNATAQIDIVEIPGSALGLVVAISILPLPVYGVRR
ncbi:MAG TPA: hypothetical protein PKL08_04785, partial [Thermoanaerobaculaceae bacterium]|nr:hypothetical protein [Thermoanaerobaculaceae bacterium]